MTSTPRAVTAAVLAVLSGCTAANPNYAGTDGRVGPGHDGGPGNDQLVASDGTGAPDARDPDDDGGRPTDALTDRVAPDAAPVECHEDVDCADQLLCTADRCDEGVCQHSLASGFCLIDGVCYLEDQLHPTDGCQRCASDQSTVDWSPAQDGMPCDADAYACTVDVCLGGQCTHDLAPGWCLIDGVCRKAGETGGDGCQICNPAKSSTQWTQRPDGSQCFVDGKPCTDDVCQGGQCTHPVVYGCLVAGVCYDEGDVAGDCLECVPSASQTDFTFVAGKPCTGTSSAAGAICAAGACRSFVDWQFQPSGPGTAEPVATSLAAVALVPTWSAPEVWAAGSWLRKLANETLPGGVLVRLDQPGQALVDKPLHAIHRRLAVGSGLVLSHDGAKWAPSLQLSALAGPRLAVWGGETAPAVDVYYLAGVVSPPASLGMYRCQLTLLGTVLSCSSSFTGFDDGVALGGVHGAGGWAGPAWAISVGGAEDIYYNDGSSAQWSQKPVEGCEDLGAGGSTPCSKTSGDFRDIHATSSSDVWVVGDNDIVLSFDGSAWHRHLGISNIASHTIDAVYSSPGDDLVTLVGYRDTVQGRRVVLYNYNRALDRWFGPVTIRELGHKSHARIFDIAGSGYADLWLVGQARPSGAKDLMGWVLHLQ